MPYFARWHAESGSMIVGGTVTPVELPAFLEALAEAARGDGAGSAIPANWLRPFLWLVERQEHYVSAIKLWRCVSGQGLKETKDFVDSLKSRSRPPPTGFEFPNVDADVLSPPNIPFEAWAKVIAKM